jgi:nucleoid DNA-binding protein
MLKVNKTMPGLTIKDDESFERIAKSPFVLAKNKKAKAFIAETELYQSEQTLVDKIATNAKITKAQATYAVETIIYTLETALKADKMALSGVKTIAQISGTVSSKRGCRTGKMVKPQRSKTAKNSSGR